MRSTMYPNDHRSSAPRIAGAGAAVAMASYALPALASSWPAGFPRSPAPIWPALRRSLGVEDRTASKRGWALTFDDGPHAQGTPAVLDALASSGVSATFFLVGEQVLRNPSLPGEILAAGHTIGLHCHRHRNLLRLAPWQVRDDLKRALAVVEEASGVSPALYRPPYGVLNASALRFARRAGWRTFLWTHWGRDWEKRATPESIASRVTDGVQEGSVLLLHDADDYSAPDSWRRMVLALPRVFDVLADSGIESVAL
ncbi:MAG TPA: polysaccharide deacetylase family protein [Solirubrobacteraceae bacterium]|nr:polysaccharide deacetylase family protein [Solirubrobacteraceae bacterium]